MNYILMLIRNHFSHKQQGCAEPGETRRQRPGPSGAKSPRVCGVTKGYVHSRKILSRYSQNDLLLLNSNHRQKIANRLQWDVGNVQCVHYMKVITAYVPGAHG